MTLDSGSSGSVGEPGRTSILQATNDGDGPAKAVVRVTAHSLCPSHAAVATLLVDADPKASCVTLDGLAVTVEADVDAGQHVVLVVEAVDLHNDTDCIRFGETEFTLELLPAS